MNKLNTKKAFTIVEVLLVLAVAGLIMLAMFIAIPAMQRSKRNTQRKNDMARIMKAITSYQGNHSGKIPLLSDSGCGTNLQCVKLDQNFVNKYIDEHVESVSENTTTYAAAYVYSFTCDADGCSKFTDPNGNVYSIVLERGIVKGGTITVSNTSSVNSAIHMIGSARCKSEGGQETGNFDAFKTYVSTTNNQNDIAITFGLEGGGIYCIDNQ